MTAEQPAASPPITTGRHDVEAIRGGVACPTCGYSLRGLRGAVVPCPECGTRCDVARLISRRWTKPWWRAPGFNAVMLPAAWPILVGIAAVLTLAVASANDWRLSKYLAVVAVVVVAAGWVLLMWRAWRAFGSGEGVALALLGHVIAPTYLAAGLTALGSAMSLIVAAVEASWAGVAGGGMVLGVAGALLWACRRGERFIADRCIRNHLRK